MQKEFLRKIIQDSENDMLEAVQATLKSLTSKMNEEIDNELNQDKMKAIIEGKRQLLMFHTECVDWLRKQIGEEIKPKDNAGIAEKMAKQISKK